MIGEKGNTMTIWTVALCLATALSAAALLFYIRRSARAGDKVLVAHGLILLVGLLLAGGGVAALKLLSF